MPSNADGAARCTPLSTLQVRFLTAGAVCAVAGLWLLTRPYQGVLLDSRVYLGRALADLAPTTIGRDLMFSHDGQAGFSVFTLLVRALVAAFGAQAAATALALTGTALWFAAAAVLMTRIAKGRLAWIMLACVAAAPAAYGGFLIIPFGEALAVPRPFAEAGVLAAFAAVLDGRRWMALGLLVAAALFHPIMAACGFAVFFVLMGWEDRRWIAPAAGLALLAVIAGALGLPVAGRLFQGVDPAWLDLLRRRNPYLFPGLWPLSTWSQSAIQIVTTLIAAAQLKGRPRALFVGAALVAVAAVGASWLMGDVWPNLLGLQIQPWRALWITAVFGAAGLGLCAASLWANSSASRIALAALAVGWIMPESPAALVAAALAIVLVAADRRPGGAAIGRPLVVAAWTIAAAAGLLQLVRIAILATRALADLPPSADALAFLISLHPLAIVAVPLAVWASVVRVESWAKPALWTAPLLGIAVLIAAVLSWDRAPSGVDANRIGDPGLMRLLAERPGSVEWIDGDVQAWALAGRAAWASELQGASIVFSRDQAMIWRDRMQQMRRLGLVQPHILDPFGHEEGAQITRPSGTALAALCQVRDGPAWIVSPVADGEASPLAANIRLWRSPSPTYRYAGDFHWSRVSTYAVIRCDAQAGAPSV